MSNNPEALSSISRRKRTSIHQRKGETSSLVNIIIKAIQDKKGKDIISINLKKIENSVCDYFVLCHGDSSTQVKAIANSVEESLKKNENTRVWHKEGYENAQWLLLDYVDIVVHVFQEQAREFYNIENLWADGELVSIPEPGPTN